MGGLEVRAVGVVRSGRSLLRDVGFSVPPGVLTALIGPNGAGKSTLLHRVLGLEPGATGRVTLDGEALDDMPARRRARLCAFVAQSETTDQRIAVADVVGLGRIPHQGLWTGGHTPQDVQAVAAALARLGLQPLADRAYDTLSGGERQRVQIARALAQAPRLMLLDEPANHLDVAAQLQLMRLLQGFVRDGMTVLASMHDLNLAAAFFDRVVALSAGRVVASGPPEAVLTPAVLAEVYGVEAEILTSGRSGRRVIACH